MKLIDIHHEIQSVTSDRIRGISRSGGGVRNIRWRDNGELSKDEAGEIKDRFDVDPSYDIWQHVPGYDGPSENGNGNGNGNGENGAVSGRLLIIAGALALAIVLFGGDR